MISMEHRYFSGFQVLREWNRIQGESSRSPMPMLFNSLIGYNQLSSNRPWKGQGSVATSVGSVRLIELNILTPQILFAPSVLENEDGALLCEWKAMEDIFPAGLMQDMSGAYARFLHRLADEEDSWHETTRQLVPSAQMQQRAVINATEAPIPVEMLHTLFAAQVSQRPHQTAVVSSSRTLTYKELYQYSNQVGCWLWELGARSNKLVAVVMEKGWEQVIAVLGVLVSGAAYLPIDPGLAKERFWYLLEHGEVDLVLTQSWLNENLEWPEGIRRLCVDNEDLLGVDVNGQPLGPIQGPDDLAYVIVTSDSTGLPMGTMIDHRSAVNTILDINQRFGVEPSDRVLALSPLSSDLSVYDVFGTLAAGGTIVIPEASATRSPARWAELIVQERVTVWNSVPALLEMLVEYMAGRPKVVPRSLRLVLLSRDWIPVTLPGQLKALFDGAQVISLGGATETSIWSVLYPIKDVDPAWKSIPYGQPMVNQRIHVLNEVMEDCPVWIPGQLYIGGIGLARGYWKDEEETRTRFVYHPRTGERLYYTGDVGRYLPDGNIEFLGREENFQVRIHGYSVELRQIEAILEQHPALRQVIVLPKEDIPGTNQLVAYLLPKQEPSFSISELRSFLKQKLPDYMIPAIFVTLNDLPLTPNGKVDRRALPVPDKASPETRENLVAPRDKIEYQLAQIWEEILGFRSIGVKDNFFDIGGNSFLAVRLMTQIQKRFGNDLPLSTFFQEATIEHLARILHQRNGAVL